MENEFENIIFKNNKKKTTNKKNAFSFYAELNFKLVARTFKAYIFYKS